MAPSLLHLPPEILFHVLSFLPIRALLKFSQTCRVSHTLATHCLHTLSLSIHPTRLASVVSYISATHYQRPKRIASHFSTLSPPGFFSSGIATDSTRSSETEDVNGDDLALEHDPYKVSVLIPGSAMFDYATLLAFHTALTTEILSRHSATLRNLDLTLWTLTMPVASALSKLPALQVLCVRIEAANARVPRRQALAQVVEHEMAWDHLAREAAWAPQLRALRIEGGQLDMRHLESLLAKNHLLQELWICGCRVTDCRIWKFLASEWKGVPSLRTLGVIGCGGDVDDDALDCISRLTGLQFLSLQDCQAIDSNVVRELNEEIWRIPEFIAPQAKSQQTNVPDFIEVDPAYNVHPGAARHTRT